MGLLKAVGRTFYKQDITVSILKQETTGNMVHVTFQLNFDNSGISFIAQNIYIFFRFKNIFICIFCLFLSFGISSVLCSTWMVTFMSFFSPAYKDKTEEKSKENTASLPLRIDVFYDLFPFHILFDREMIIRSIGKSLRATLDEISGYDVTQVFALKKPLVDFSWDSVNLIQCLWHYDERRTSRRLSAPFIKEYRYLQFCSLSTPRS